MDQTCFIKFLRVTWKFMLYIRLKKHTRIHQKDSGLIFNMPTCCNILLTLNHAQSTGINHQVENLSSFWFEFDFF